MSDMKRMEPLRDSSEICEALVRHLEIMGEDVFEKNLVQPHGKAGAKITCSVFCIVGDNAEAFTLMCRKWLTENGFEET